jgi:hypothetical protein
VFALPILLAATLLEETSETLGKKGVRQGRETVFNLAFLSMFWTVIFLIISVFLGAKLKLNPSSFPTLSLRILVECLLDYAAALAVVRADRSTLGFLRLMTIPIVLIADIGLGYHLSVFQLVGVLIMFAGLAVAFHKAPTPRGLWNGISVSILGATSITLYKWDVTHYNSVAAEQILVYSCVLVVFFIISCARSGSPLKLLMRRQTGTQSVTFGLGLAVESFAINFAPASVIVALKRTLAVMWTIIFGRHYFRETRTRQKVFAGAVLVVGLVMIVLH